MGWALFFRSLSSLRISVIRSAEARAMMIMVSTMESIIRLISIIMI